MGQGIDQRFDGIRALAQRRLFVGRQLDLDDLLETAEGDLFVLAMAWAALADRAPDAALLQRTRRCTDLPTILEALRGRHIIA